MLKFKDVLQLGLTHGFVTIKRVMKVDYDNDKDVFDHFQAIEELEDRGIKIRY